MKGQKLVWIALACCLLAGAGVILLGRGSSRQEAHGRPPVARTGAAAGSPLR